MFIFIPLRCFYLLYSVALLLFDYRITKLIEILRQKSPELNPMDYYVWENIRGQPQVLSKTEDIAELKEMLQITV